MDGIVSTVFTVFLFGRGQVHGSSFTLWPYHDGGIEGLGRHGGFRTGMADLLSGFPAVKSGTFSLLCLVVLLQSNLCLQVT